MNGNIRIDPESVYDRGGVAAILGIERATFSRYAKRHGLKFSARRGGWITGRKLLEWIESRNANAR